MNFGKPKGSATRVGYCLMTMLCTEINATILACPRVHKMILQIVSKSAFGMEYSKDVQSRIDP